MSPPSLGPRHHPLTLTCLKVREKDNMRMHSLQKKKGLFFLYLTNQNVCFLLPATVMVKFLTGFLVPRRTQKYTPESSYVTSVISMMAPRIWIRGVGRSRTPCLYQFTAMPGRVFMSQRSFRMFPGSSRRCSVVSSLRS